MAMRFYVTNIFSLFVIAFFSQSLFSTDFDLPWIDQDYRCMQVSYIQGGAPDGGDGSRNHPYNSFAQAEGGNWDILRVLSSKKIIQGGICLNDGQQIVGENKATCLIANEDPSDHNGDVFVAQGDNRISKITVTTAYRCAVDALNAGDLFIEDCSFNQCNPSRAVFPRDYVLGNTTTMPSAWNAISFFGGPTVTSGIQPYNKRSGTLVVQNCSFSSNAGDIFFGSGDSISTGFVEEVYKRDYEIAGCHFSDTLGNAVSGYPSGGGRLEGVTRECSFQGNIGIGISFTSIFANNPNFPGRGNCQFGKIETSDCSLQNVGSLGVFIGPNGHLLESCPRFIVRGNHFHTVGSGQITPPAAIEVGAASIQTQINSSASGMPIYWVVRDNVIIDPTGLAPSITTFFLGGSNQLLADIQHNLIEGTTTGVNILNFTSTDNPQIGDFNIARNAFKNNDSVLIVASAAPYANLKVKVEKNQFICTGARNSPSIQEPPYESNGSYYGGAVIFGGANNTALQAIGQESANLGNAIVDLGGGPLNSEGLNSFIHTTGADTWVEPGLTLWARRNWFGGGLPSDAGVGGKAIFNPILKCKPKQFYTIRTIEP
jgi:hypothetical protein